MQKHRNKLGGAILVMLLVLVAGVLSACGSETTATTAPAATTISEASIPSTTASTQATQSTTGSTAAAAPQELLVSAAAGLKGAFTELGQAFDKANGSKTTFNFAAAGTLAKQIEGGAPADVFASSDPKFMTNLAKAGLIDSASVKPFASNHIVLIVPAESAAGVAGFADLAKSTVKKVATGNPETTPLGAATLQILPALKIEESVKPKLVYTETVNQTLTYVTGGDVDAGVVWSSEAKAGGDKVKVAATADPTWYGKVEFDLGLLSAAKDKTLAQAFVAFVLSDEGQSILKKYGWVEATAQ